MEWLKSTDYGKYEGLTKNYMDYISRLYEREIKDFFEVAKIKMTGTTKESKKFGKLRHLSPLFSVLLKMVLLTTNNSRLFRQSGRDTVELMKA